MRQRVNGFAKKVLQPATAPLLARLRS